ncbi:hypothetical protein BDR22DRAFT_952368, partial [Usnea florida]
MTTTEQLILPGETISPEILPIPSNPSLPLKLGPGLRHTPPSTITSVVAGALCIDQKKNAIWVENNSGRYHPQPNDLVLATIHHSSTDYYHCTLTPHTPPALLPHLAFEHATKKTRPQLAPSTLIYARVLAAPPQSPDLVLSCCDPSTGKAEGMGELKGGMVFDVSLGMARRLLVKRLREDAGLVVLEEVGRLGVAFEVAVGRNGRVWVRSGGVRETLVVGRAVQETDREGLGVEEQGRLVRRLLK